MNREMGSTLERFLHKRTPQTHASGPAAAFSGAFSGHCRHRKNGKQNRSVHNLEHQQKGAR